MKLSIVITSLCVLMMTLTQGAFFSVHAEELPDKDSWKAEFSDISSHSVTAMSLTDEELTALIERCEKLKPAIENLEATPRKIYLKRLEKTKALFEFVIESRKEGS